MKALLMIKKHIQNHKIFFFLTTISIFTLFTTEVYSQTEIKQTTSPFNRAIIFGDSLSDNGHFSGWSSGAIEKYIHTRLTNGHFSNGSVWNEYLFPDQKRGIGHYSVFPLWMKTDDFGNNTDNRDINVNYAVGGATYLPDGRIKSIIIPILTKQIDSFVQGNKGKQNTISPNTIVSLWAGGNDALNVITYGGSIADKANSVKGRLSNNLDRLYEAGARHFLVPDMPDFTKVPRFLSTHSSAPQETTEAFNKAIGQSIGEFKNKHPDAIVYAPNVAGMLGTVIRNPDVFGYKNVTDACIRSAECNKAPTGSDQQNSYLFWDDIHPTTRTHSYVANYMRTYWQNPDLAGFYVTSPESQFKTERNFFFLQSDKTVAGYLTGDKALYKLEKGKLTLTGDHSYTGGTFVKEGELQLGNGGETGSVTGDVDLNKQTILSFNRSNLYDFDGIITGKGDVLQKGSGRTVLNGHSTYSGETRIMAGELDVNGSISSNTHVYSGGTISGSGSIGGLVAESGSIVAPGDFSVAGKGTLNVTSDIYLNRGSTLHISVGTDGATSGLHSSGMANLGGNVIFGRDQRGVPLSVDETIALLGKSSTFLKADNGINGQFEKAEPKYQFIGAELDYRKTEVNVTFKEAQKRFHRAAANENGNAVADAVQEQGFDNHLHNNIFVATYDDNLSAAYSQLSGDIYASLQTSLLQDNTLTRNAVQQRMENVFANQAELLSQKLNAPLPSGAWGQLYNSNARWNSDSNAQSMKRSLSGFITGIDSSSAQNWHLGVFTGYMHSSVQSGNASASIDSYQLGAYGGREWDKLKLSFGASASLHDIDSSRSFTFMEINDRNRTDFRGSSYQAFAEFSYDIDTQLARVTPFAGLAYNHLKLNNFTENTTSSSLSGAAGRSDMVSTTLGLRLGQTYTLSDTLSLATVLSAGWQHNSTTQPSARLSFVNGNDFKIDGLAPARDALLLQAGLQLNLKQNTSLGLSYQGQLAKRVNDHTIKADFIYRF